VITPNDGSAPVSFAAGDLVVFRAVLQMGSQESAEEALFV
jgi:hypothetical protein